VFPDFMATPVGRIMVNASRMFLVVCCKLL
jgi:hypothetical protein